MQFLFPAFLFGLLALAVPIIIHLFYFRRFKKVYFTNVKFLKELKQETSSRQRLRNLLVLLMRCLALAALVFAFAQPFIPKNTTVKQGLKAISIFVDNSYSMSSLSKDISLVEKAKQRAREIINAYTDNDKFQILTNDFEGKHQRLISKEDALIMLDEIKVSPGVKELSKVLKRQQQILNTSDLNYKVAYLISDFQKNISDLSAYKDTLIEVNLIPLQSVEEKNIAIDSCWFEVPVQMANQVNPLVVRVHNYGKEKAENVKLSLTHNGQEKPVGNLSIAAGAVVTDTINMSIEQVGWHEAIVKITDYPVQFDDQYYFTFNVAKQIDVLCINEDNSNRYLDAVFKGINYFKLTNINSKNIDYSKLPAYKLIICNGLRSISSGLAQEFTQYMKAGGNVLIFPSEQSDLISYKSYLTSIGANDLLAFQKTEKVVAKMNFDDFVFKDVYINPNANLKLPTTTGSFSINEFSGKAMEKLLSYRDGSTYLAKYKIDKGNQYLCMAPLDDKYNDLVRSAEVFVPMVYKMAISTSKAGKLAYTLGKDDYIEADVPIEEAPDKVYKLQKGKEEIIPEQKTIGAKLILGINNLVAESGFYKMFDAKNELVNEFAFNFNRKESDLSCYTPSEIKEKLNHNMNLLNENAEANFTSIVGERDKGIILWKWFVVLALIFLALESLIIRFWKV